MIIDPNNNKSTDFIIAKAFDCVVHFKLFLKLSSYSISGNLFHWIDEFCQTDISMLLLIVIVQPIVRV